MRLKYLLDELDMARLAKSKAYTLSGGEKRRLEITRALVTSPKLLLLDEPFSGIDPIAVYEVQKIVRRLKERGLGILITDHNVRETLKLVDRAYLIHKGEVVYEGVARAVGQRPQSARNLFGPGIQPMKPPAGKWNAGALECWSNAKGFCRRARARAAPSQHSITPSVNPRIPPLPHLLLCEATPSL